MGATISKFFDELMESVREMDEILRGECAPSRISKAGKMIQKNQQTLDEQPRFKDRKSRPITPHDCATLESCNKRPMK